MAPAGLADQWVAPQIVVASSHTGGVHDIVFSRDGKWMASIGGRVIKIWDAAHFRQIGAFAADCSDATFSPDSASLICGTHAATGLKISEYDARTGRLLFASIREPKPQRPPA